MATSLSSGMLLGDMGDWYNDLLASYGNAGTASSVPPATTQPRYQFDPGPVGSDIGQYYTSALSAQPGYESILRNIAGIVAPDVKRQIAQTAAERGVGIGSYGGANDATALLRALGLTSMDLTNKGLEQYRQAYAAVPALPPTSLFVSPAEQARLAQELTLGVMKLREAAREAELNRAARVRELREETARQERAAGARLAASQYGYETSRADRDAATALRLEQIAASNRAMQASPFAGAQPNVWYSGTNLELDQPSTLPSWWGQASPESETPGVYYSGAALTPMAEEAVMGGYFTPSQLGVPAEEYDYYMY